MAHLFIFGLGYSATRIRSAAEALGWRVTGTGREAELAFEDEERVRSALDSASHVLSSVPPGESGDPVLDRYGDALAHDWLGYLSSTGVYGDTGGAWVDESTPLGAGRRAARSLADRAWLARGARVFRLPGIYGPGRSALDRVAEGRAHRIDLPGQVFSRVHVDDIAQGVIAGFAAPQCVAVAREHRVARLSGRNRGQDVACRAERGVHALVVLEGELGPAPRCAHRPSAGLRRRANALRRVAEAEDEQMRHARVLRVGRSREST